MLKVIVFSFDRALQLETLLSSMQSFCKMPVQITVIYNTSSEFYEDGYKKLQKNYCNAYIKFIKEKPGRSYPAIKECMSWTHLYQLYKYPRLRCAKTDFKQLIQQEIEEAEFEFFMFLTDDSIFYREFDIRKDIFEWIAKNVMQRSFSCRLGKAMNREPVEHVKKMGTGTLTWHYSDCSPLSNWGYQFSVDGHIYHRIFLREAVKNVLFINPNTFEPNVCSWVRRKHYLDEGMAYVNSVLLSFPLNMVQSVCQNESCNIPKNVLNEKFLAGWKLNLKIPEKLSDFQIYPKELSFEKDGVTEIMYTGRYQ